MKKLLALLLVFLMLISTFTGCEDDNTSSESSSKEQISSEEQLPSEKPQEPEAPSSSEAPSIESEPEDTADVPSEEPEEPEEPPYEYEEDEEIAPSVPLTPEEERLENILAGYDESLNKDSLYSEGNLARVAKAIKKSKGGEMVRIVFYGNVNSSHNSNSSSMADTPYTRLFQYWWEDNVGPCDVIGAGGENLTSINATMRVEHDVLQWEPDIVFLDFAVQDNIQAMAKSNAQAYDNLIRRILQSKSSPAVVTMLLTGAEQTSYTMNPKNANIFASAAKQQKELAKYYNLPIIDFETAVWDNMVELVQVKETGDIPLLTWYDISFNNVVMNNDGHVILNGALIYFINHVLKKLDKISTKDPQYPTEGFYGMDKYMNASFQNIGDIVEGKVKGYAFDLDTVGLNEYAYGYTTARASDTYTPYITTYRHYVPESDTEEELALEESPHYLNLTIPEVTNNDTYFMVYTSATVSTKNISNKNILKFAPVSILCYDANGNLLTNTKAPNSNFTETASLGKTSAVKLAQGTTRIEFKIFSRGGVVKLLGIGNLNTNS